MAKTPIRPSKKKKPVPRKVHAEIVDDSENQQSSELISKENSDDHDINSDENEAVEPFVDIEPDVDLESIGSSSEYNDLPDSTTEFSDESEQTKEKSLAIVPRTTREITSNDPLVLYLNEIRKYPVLSKEEEKKIAEKYFATKDPASAEVLVKSNLRFVVKIAAEYSKFGAKMIDLIQEGNVGLMHAVREYNPHKGARVITYAVWWIRGYIQEYLMRQFSMVRIGTTQAQRKLFYQLQKHKDSLAKLGQAPNVEQLSEKLGISKEEIESMTQRMSGRDVSLDKPLDEETGVRLSDMQSTSEEENLEETLALQEQLAILKGKIETLRPTLNEREKILLEERLLADEPLTLQEIGDKYGITREAVRQAESRLMKKIKDSFQ